MADAAARVFYDRLFAIDATTRPLFKDADLAEQRRKLIQALGMVVNGLDHVEALVPAVQHLGRRHAQYGVMDRHYDTVEEALLWTLASRGSGQHGRRRSRRLGKAPIPCWPLSAQRGT